jgi:NAD(P)-dependent dehydrogenase (short-subunit alcohol dehydrogenase family)
VKILLALLFVFLVFVGIFLINNEPESSIEILSGSTSDVAILEADVQEQTSSKSTADSAQENTPSTIQAAINNVDSEKMDMDEWAATDVMATNEEFEATIDANAVSPEDESVQSFYGEAMIVSESDSQAPEAGSEMTTSGATVPMTSSIKDDNKSSATKQPPF